jgi:hypothetical protein
MKCYTIGWIICKTFSAASSLQCNTNFKKQIKITLMRKVFLTMAAVVAIASASFAQSGKNEVSVGAEVGLPMGDFGEGFKTGFGGSLKGLFGIGAAGQITGTVGYTSFKMKGSMEDMSVTTGILPILAGYRHNFSGFYVEPQVGYSIMRVKANVLGESGSESTGAFAWAAGAGYQFSGIDLGVRYQSLSKDGESLGQIAFRVAKSFSLGGSR